MGGCQWDDIPFVYAGVPHPEAILTPGTNRKAHPAQMPVALAARCIVFFTATGDLVCDPFSGSGTTGEACLRLHRRFLGMEREAEYCALAEQRWAAVRQQPDLLHSESAAWQPSRANHGNGGAPAAWRDLL